jgi:hypothetical protein
MNEVEARAVLGISATATLSEARKAHRDLAKVFHPDRHATATNQELQRANDAMARINHAFETLEQLSANGRLGSNEADGARWNSSQSEPNWRPPRVSECFMCGCGPATHATFQGYSGFLFWFTSQKFQGSFCRPCGLMLFRETQAINLTRGWWGIVILPMLYVAVANVFNFLKINRLPLPSVRDANVVTPLPFPSPRVRPVLGRLRVWIASGFAIFILISWIGSSVQTGSPSGNTTTSNSETSTTVSANPTPDPDEAMLRLLDQRKYLIGSCWSAPDASGRITPVVCSDPTALFEVSQVVFDEIGCPSDSEGSVNADNGSFACLRYVQ